MAWDPTQGQEQPGNGEPEQPPNGGSEPNPANSAPQNPYEGQEQPPSGADPYSGYGSPQNPYGAPPQNPYASTIAAKPLCPTPTIRYSTLSARWLRLWICSTTASASINRSSYSGTAKSIY